MIRYTRGLYPLLQALLHWLGTTLENPSDHHRSDPHHFLQVMGKHDGRRITDSDLAMYPGWKIVKSIVSH